MRKLLLLIGMILGAAVGLFASLTGGIGVKIVMMSIGAVAGAAIGGALSRVGKRSVLRHDANVESTFPAHDPALTYWRDKGEIYPMPGHPDPEAARREHP